MPRKGPVAKRDVLPDPIYNSKLVTRLINRVMVDGKRGIAANIIYNAFDLIKESTGNDPLEVLLLKNVKTLIKWLMPTVRLLTIAGKILSVWSAFISRPQIVSLFLATR